MLRRFVMLAAFVALALPSLATAQDIRTRIGLGPAPARIVVYGQPRFVQVSGTDVYALDNLEGNDELYSYGGYYYLSSDGYWYRSTNWRGPWRAIQEGIVPDQVFVAVDNRSGQSYNDNDYDNNYDNNAPPPPRIVLYERPRFIMIRGTDVYRVANVDDYRVYRYGNLYYVNDGGAWFRATNVRGPYTIIRTEALPRPVYTVTTYRTTHRYYRRTYDNRRRY